MGRILFVLALIGCVLPKMLHAQNPPFTNPSLDSNCFFPQIGRDIDTIYGAPQDTVGDFVYGTGIGAYIHNLGRKPDGSLGNVLIGNFRDGLLSNQFQNPLFLKESKTGPGFDLHNLKGNEQDLFLNEQYICYGRFHDQTHLDLFDGDWWRIYWADDNGNYDSSRYTQLSSSIPGVPVHSSSDAGPFYIAHLSQDTVDDLVTGVVTARVPVTLDSLFLLHFKGGNTLFEKKQAFEDTSLAWGPAGSTSNHSDFIGSIDGDFRGTRRKDLLVFDRQGNIYFYKNDTPFSLQNLANAVRLDTLWPHAPDYGNGLIVMPLFPKKSGDSSLDIAYAISVSHQERDTIYLFRGGPDFGSHRLELDSAAFVIPPPRIDYPLWPGSLIDGGNMTGTGNHVLCTTGGARGSAGYTDLNFYVCGQALDDKIDLFYSNTNAGPRDTLTANSDSLEDLLLASYAYTSPQDISNGLRSMGTIWLMYGSKQIPVHLNPQFAGVETTQHLDISPLTCTPNPATRSTVLHIKWPESEAVTLVVRDMLGCAVETEQLRLEAGESELRLAVGALAAGVYFVTVEGASRRVSTGRFVKIGDAVPEQRGSFMQSLRARVHGDVPALPGGTTLPH